MDKTYHDSADKTWPPRTREFGEAEELPASVIDQVVDGIITLDEHATVTVFNRAAEKMFGYAASEVVGQNIKLLMPEPHSSQTDSDIANQLSRAAMSLSGRRWEGVGRRKNGSALPMELAIRVFSSQHGRCFTAIVRDLTESNQVEEESRQGEVRMRSIVDNLIDGIITIDENGIVESYNPAAETIFGYSATEVRTLRANRHRDLR
jgi:PAS domain S-box-containing protein